MSGTGESKIGPALDRALGDIDPRLRRVLFGWAVGHPLKYPGLWRLVRGYWRASEARKKELGAGLLVPPFLIMSITARCNLRCAGCYAAVSGIRSRKQAAAELDIASWRRIISEACEAGVYSFIIAGGEPFLFPGLLDLVAEFRDRVFIIVTNGTAISARDHTRLKKLANVVVVVSLEGSRELTDARRGDGVHARVMDTLRILKKNSVVSGISVTLNRLNFKHWMAEKSVDEFVGLGIKLGVFIEYIPTVPGGDCSCTSELTGSLCPSKKLLEELYSKEDGSLVLMKEERTRLRTRMLQYRDSKPFYLIHSPGDEEAFGGCVSAGRGFAHITPAGDLTPCPVSNVATHNLERSPMKEALASRLFARIREDGHLLESGDTPCALFAHPGELEALAREVGAYRTGEGNETRPKKHRSGKSPAGRRGSP